MGAHNLDFTEIIAAVPERRIPPQLKMAALAMIGLGLAATAFGFFTDVERTWTAFIFNFMYFMGIAQGAFMLCVATTIAQGRWGRPLKRFGEGLLLYTLVLYVLLAVYLIFGMDSVHVAQWFEHGPELPAHKAVYLTKPFFIARMLGGLLVLIALSLMYVRSSLRADLGVAKEQLGDKAPAWWDRLIGGWKGKAEESAAQSRYQSNISPFIVLAYAVVFSFLAVDMSMSLDAHWFANMFPAWYFMSCFWSGLVWLGILSILSRNWLGISHLLTGKIYHDLGKLTFGLTMFWGYTTFATFLAIWYGNMTEEIGFILLRVKVAPWSGMAQVVAMLCFLVPWTMLLSRSLKKIPSAYLAVTGIIAVGIWLERFLVVVPSVWEGTTLPLGPIEIGMGIGLLGGMLLTTFAYLSRVPPVPVNDPYMHPHPDEVHVHPSSQHAH